MSEMDKKIKDLQKSLANSKMSTHLNSNFIKSSPESSFNEKSESELSKKLVSRGKVTFGHLSWVNDNQSHCRGSADMKSLNRLQKMKIINRNDTQKENKTSQKMHEFESEDEKKKSGVFTPNNKNLNKILSPFCLTQSSHSLESESDCYSSRDHQESPQIVYRPGPCNKNSFRDYLNRKNQS